MNVELVPLDSLRTDPKNTRSHGERNLESIKASLARFGQQKPIVVAEDGTIVAGNGTLEAARALGWKEIRIARTQLQGPEAQAYAIADNRTAELAEWNEAALAAAFQELQQQTYDPTLTGFTAEEIERLVREVTGWVPTEDEVPEPPDEATTRLGDLWILGDHRLLCGDSASQADVDRLLGGAPVHLVNTDPPYNVKVEPRSNNAIAAGLSSFSTQHHQQLDLARHPEKSEPTTMKLRAKDRPLANDFVSDEEFQKMLYAWFGNIARVLLPGRGFYIWGGYANCSNYPKPLADCGLYFSQAIIWVKGHPVLTRKDFMGNHEWCFYGWREGAAHQWYGPNNAVDVWEIKKVNPQSMVHLTEKPVELAARAMEYSSQRDEHILDLFGGSGSTLIAAEQMQRKAFLMELDTLYTDVIVMRWEKFTGRKAVLEGTGKTFEQAAEKTT